MTGRGIDQILSHPSDPILHESYLQRATDYVELAEQKSGLIPRHVSADYIWGDAIEELQRVSPDARIINLETTITRSDDWCDKGINYRMSPKNISCLKAAQIDVCVLSNNHILDWGAQGLIDTVESLKGVGIQAAGAGAYRQEAEAPAFVNHSQGGRVIVLAFGSQSSGVPRSWMATDRKPGVHLLEDFSESTLQRISERVMALKRPGDVVIFSIHWGDNWGYEVPDAHRRFARALIDRAQIDVVHGHSSHHVKQIEVYQGKLILYGCGDFITDYEGISGYETYRGDLTLMYFPKLSPQTGELISCKLIPLKMHRFQLKRPSDDEMRWLHDVLCREGAKVGTSVSESEHGFDLKWR